MEHIYFDNAATTKPCISAISAAHNALINNFHNPSSMHTLGFLASSEIKKAAKNIGNFLNVSGDNLIFTSGGTESNNIAIFGAVSKNISIVSSKAEHASVLEPIKKLEQNGLEVQYVPHLTNGIIDIASFEKNIFNKRVFVSLMQTNNETGVISDVSTIGKLIKTMNPDSIFHVDGVQSFCKQSGAIDLKYIDLFSISSHKIHGLKGLGALYIKPGTHISPMFYGGEQQGRLRPGTENLPQIVAFSAAAQSMTDNHNANYASIKLIQKAFISGISTIENAYINGVLVDSNYKIDNEKISPYIVNVCFLGVKAGVLQNALSEHGVYISTSAACHKGQGSSVLTAYGLDKSFSNSSVRFSFSKDNNINEVELCVQILSEQVKFLRKFNVNN